MYPSPGMGMSINTTYPSPGMGTRKTMHPSPGTGTWPPGRCDRSRVSGIGTLVVREPDEMSGNRTRLTTIRALGRGARLAEAVRMLACVESCTLIGIDALPVKVE